MSLYLDTITLIWALGALLIYSQWLFIKPNRYSTIGFFLAVTYLFAQTSWVAAFVQGDVWGREIANFIWFGFNTLVFGLLTLIWLDKR